MFKNPLLYPIALSTSVLVFLLALPSQGQPIAPYGFIRYESERGGQDGHTNLGIRLPLTQQTSSFLFFEPHLKVFDNGNLGSSAVLGWRSLNESREDIIGTFLAYDNRNVSGTLLHQLSVGVEYKRKNFGIYLSGFLPVGTEQASAGIGRVLQTNFFDGPFYVFERREQRFNNAMSGLELTADTMIPIGQNYLRPQLSLYYLDSPVNNTVGVRGQIQYEHSWFNVGFGAQHDSLFDTRIFFRIGVNLPRHRRSSRVIDIKDQLYDDVQKPNTITVYNAPNGTSDILAINPDTNQPYQFYIVTDDPTGLAGTPVVFPGTVSGLTAALSNAASAGGNGVTYVYQQNGSLAPFNSNFTVGNGVKLISSSAPISAYFNRSLPFIALRGVGGSPEDFDNFLVVNDGQPLPQINGTLNLTGGNRQAVVGFNLNPTGRGIDGVNNSNIIILSNQINNASNDGIRLQNANGLVEVINNQVRGTTSESNASAISVTASGGNIVIADSIIENTQSTNAAARGIEIQAIGNTSNISVLDFVINNTEGENRALGVDINANGGNINTVAVGGNNIVQNTRARAGGVLGDGASGIAISTITSNAIQTVNISGTNEIRNTQADFSNGTALGLTVATAASNSVINQVNISANNTIDNTTTLAPLNASAGGIGIVAAGAGSNIGQINLTGNNTVTNTRSGDQAGGIGVTANGNNSTIGTINITGTNTIENTTTTGFQAVGLAIATIGQNAAIATNGQINLTGSTVVNNVQANPIGNSIAFGVGIITTFNTNTNSQNSTIAQNGVINATNLSINQVRAFNGATGFGILAGATQSSIASGGSMNISNVNIQDIQAGINSTGIGIATGFPSFPVANGQTLGNINLTGSNVIQSVRSNLSEAAGISIKVPDAATNSTIGNIVLGSLNSTERTSIQDIQGLGLLFGRAYGVEVLTGIGTTMGNVTIRNMDVGTTSQVRGAIAARGIYVQAGSTANNPTSGTMGTVLIENNNVGSLSTPVEITSPSFRDSIGILVRAINNNTIGNTTVRNNTVGGVVATAQGRAQGIVVNSFTSNVPFAASPLIGSVGGSPSIVIENNTVNAGNGTTLTTDGIHVGTEIFNFTLPNNPQIGRAVIRNNTVDVQSNNLVGQSGASGIKIYNDNNLPPSNRNHVNVDILENQITFRGGNFAPTVSPNDGSSSGIFVQANTATAARPVCVRIENNQSSTTNTNNAHFRFRLGGGAGSVALFNASPSPIPNDGQLGAFLTSVGNATSGGSSTAATGLASPNIPAINPLICPNY